MKYRYCIYLLIICCSSLVSQQSHIRLYINNGIDTTKSDIRQVIRVWEQYLNSSPDSAYDNPYWLNAEKRQYEKYDFLNSTYFNPSLYYFFSRFKPTVMSVLPADSGYVIRTMLAKTDSGFSLPFCIVRVMAVKENDTYLLCNILSFNTKSWQKKKIEHVTFMYPPAHHFNSKLAHRLTAFVDSLTSIWNIKAIPVEFYLAGDVDELMRIRGLDYYIGEGFNQGKGGFADITNHIVFGGGQEEWYPHEFVHIYINPLFPKAHYYFLEGYAALLGGSKGHDLPWHTKRMQEYLDEHPELDLTDLLSFRYWDSYTDPKYVFGGLFCRLALEKGGLPALKQLFSYGTEDEDFYRAIETVVGIKQQELNQFVRTKLTEGTLK